MMVSTVAFVVLDSVLEGILAPPLVGYYAACAIGQVPPDLGMRRNRFYLGALPVGLLAVAAVPCISTGFL